MAPHPGEPVDRLGGQGIGRAGGGQHQGVELAHPRTRQGLAQPAVEHAEERGLQAEHVRGADLEPLVTRGGGRDDAGDVDLGVVGLAQQERDDDDLVVAGLHQPVDDRAELGLRELQEGRLDPQVGTHRADLADEVAHGGGGSGVAAAMSKCHQGRCGHVLSLLSLLGSRRGRVLRGVRCGGPVGSAAVRVSSGQTWMPHSVLPVPDQRPARGSSPGATRRVQGAQPIEG